MKCIRCNHDSKYPERPKRKCPGCGGTFAFEPREGDPVTDVAFKKAIEAVSAEGRVRWGVEHLYYEVCRRTRFHPALVGCLAVAAGAVAVAAAITGIDNPLALWALIPAGLLGLIALATHHSSRFPRVDDPTFRRLYDRWVEVHGAPPGVIVRMPQPSELREVEPDIADYSFDRAVICDRARTVDLLLANNFHFENNCAVLSVEGYPSGLFETVRKMIKRNPRLAVYALHDATPKGCALAHQLATDPNWFAGQVKVIDVGLRPSHAPRFRGLLLGSKTPGVATSDAITAWEAAWLASYALEVAAVRPEQVIKRLFHAINLPINAAHPGPVIYLAPRDQGKGDGNGGIVFSFEAADADGPADAFG
ncbi:MAG: hypothetical protein L0Z62_13870 [Gemmataceae bacterium]|nr:hypothetical protein [Gemmataceae bacterium]